MYSSAFSPNGPLKNYYPNLSIEMNMPEADRLAWVKFCKEQRAYFDRLHPSEWEGPSNSRGWERVVMANASIEGGFLPKISIWMPAKFREDMVKTVNGQNDHVLIIEAGNPHTGAYDQPLIKESYQTRVNLFVPSNEEKYLQTYVPTVVMLSPGIFKPKINSFL